MNKYKIVYTFGNFEYPSKLVKCKDIKEVAADYFKLWGGVAKFYNIHTSKKKFLWMGTECLNKDYKHWEERLEIENN